MTFNQAPHTQPDPSPPAAPVPMPTPLPATTLSPAAPSGSAPPAPTTRKPGARSFTIALTLIVLFGGAALAYKSLIRSDPPARPPASMASGLPTPQALDIARDTRQAAAEFKNTASQIDKQRADETLQYGLTAEGRKELAALKQEFTTYKAQTDRQLRQLGAALDRVRAAPRPPAVAAKPVAPVEKLAAPIEKPAAAPPPIVAAPAPPALDTEKLLAALRTEIRSAVRDEVSKIPPPVVTIAQPPPAADASGLEEIDISDAHPSGSPAAAPPQPAPPRPPTPSITIPARPATPGPATSPRPNTYNAPQACEASVLPADTLEDAPSYVLRAQYVPDPVPPTYLPPLQGANPTPYPVMPARPITPGPQSNEATGQSAPPPGPAAGLSPGQPPASSSAQSPGQPYAARNAQGPSAPKPPEMTDILLEEPDTKYKYMLDPRTKRHYIPRYSVAPAILFTGAVAPATNSTSEPLPVAGIISGPVIAPGNITILLHGTCNFGGVARGNAATSRVFIAVLRLSCVSPSGEIWEAPAEARTAGPTTASIGFTTGHWDLAHKRPDNYLGIEAKKVSDEGPLLLLRAFLDIGADYAKATAQAQVTTTSTPGAISGGTTAANVTGSQDLYIWGSALGNRSLPDISAFVTKLLNEALPYFYVPSGTELFIVLTEPVDITNVLYDYLPPGVDVPATARGQH